MITTDKENIKVEEAVTVPEVPEALKNSQYLQQLQASGLSSPFGFTPVQFPSSEDGGPELSFKEVWFKKEVYQPIFFEDGPTLEESLKDLLTRSSEACADFRKTEYLCFSIETYAQEGPQGLTKGVSRVVLIDQAGQRVFDSQVRLFNEASSNRKATNKLIKNWVQEVAPTFDEVQAAVLRMISGKKLVGYHLLQKLKELQIIDKVERSTPSGEDALYEMSNLFDDKRGVQVPFDSLCQRFLNLKYQKRKNQPHAMSEARIAMALFHKWASRNGVKIGGAAPLAELPTTKVDDSEEMTGAELQTFIKLCVRKSLQRNLESMMANLKHL